MCIRDSAYRYEMLEGGLKPPPQSHAQPRAEIRRKSLELKTETPELKTKTPELKAKSLKRRDHKLRRRSQS